MPSVAAAEIINGYYNHLELKVQEHKLGYAVFEKTFQEDFVKIRKLTVAVIGNIHQHKGSNLIYKLAELLAEKNIPIKIKVWATMEVGVPIQLVNFSDSFSRFSIFLKKFQLNFLLFNRINQQVIKYYIL